MGEIMVDGGKSGNCEICGFLDKLFHVRTKTGIWRWLCPFCINQHCDN